MEKKNSTYVLTSSSSVVVKKTPQGISQSIYAIALDVICSYREGIRHTAVYFALHPWHVHCDR